MDENDLWIAATTLSMNATLVSRDTDFLRVDGLNVVETGRSRSAAKTVAAMSLADCPKPLAASQGPNLHPARRADQITGPLGQ